MWFRKVKNPVFQSDLNSNIILSLEKVYLTFRRLLWKYAEQEKLSPIQIQFLIYLTLHSQRDIFMTDIAREYNLTTATVSDALKVLEKKGLIKREVTDKDRRKYFINLTEKGKKVTKKLSGWQNPLQMHLQQFPWQTREIILIFLLKFIESLKNGKLLEEAKTCLSCEYYKNDNTLNIASQNYCLLRNVPLNISDLRINCPNYKVKNIK